MRIQTMITVTAMAAALSAAQASADVPAEYHGRWALDCADRSADEIVLGSDRVTVGTRGGRHAFTDVETSYSFYGGAKADGSNAWLLVSAAPGQPYAFVAEIPGTGRQGPMVLEDGAPGQGDAVAHLFGQRFSRCSS